MTPADHAALSAKLARAIGWRRVDVTEIVDYEQVHVGWSCAVYLPNWMPKAFDYRDPSVALPVLEWLGNEKRILVRPAIPPGKWMFQAPAGDSEDFDTLPEAIARAAIAVADAKCQQVEQNEAREVLQP